MSFTAEYGCIDIANANPNVRTALVEVLKSHGWELIDNVELKNQGLKQVGVRAHGAEAGKIYPLMFRNSGEEYSSYDIGVDYNEDGSTKMVFDRYLGSVNAIFGDDARALSKEVLIHAAKISKNALGEYNNPAEIRNLSTDEYMQRYVTNTNGEPMSVEDLKSQEELIHNTMEDPLCNMMY